MSEQCDYIVSSYNYRCPSTDTVKFGPYWWCPHHLVEYKYEIGPRLNAKYAKEQADADKLARWKAASEGVGG